MPTEMTVWRTRPVADQPEVKLTHWQIFRLPDGAAHAVGYNVRDGEGRVSSELIALDLLGTRVRTRSGRIYQLVGDPGWHSDAEYVLGHWCAINQVEYQSLGFISIEELSTLPGLE